MSAEPTDCPLAFSPGLSSEAAAAETSSYRPGRARRPPQRRRRPQEARLRPPRGRLRRRQRPEGRSLHPLGPRQARGGLDIRSQASSPSDGANPLGPRRLRRTPSARLASGAAETASAGPRLRCRRRPRVLVRRRSLIFRRLGRFALLGRFIGRLGAKEFRSFHFDRPESHGAQNRSELLA